MTSVQTENGFTRIANELLEEISRFKFNGTEFRIIMTIWRFTYGFQRKQHELSTSFIANAIGMDNSRVRKVLKDLIDSNVVLVLEDASFNKSRVLSFNKNYKEWGVEKDQRGQIVPHPSKTPQPEGSKRTQGEGANTPQPQGSNSTPKKERTKERVKKDIKIAEIADSEIENPVDLKQESEIDIMPEEYVKRLLNRFVELRAYGFDFKPMDLSAAKEIQSAGVPLEEAISGLEEAFRNYNPRHPRDRINSLSYCVGFILDRHFPAPEKTNVTSIYERGGNNETDKRSISRDDARQSRIDETNERRKRIAGIESNRDIDVPF